MTKWIGMYKEGYIPLLYYIALFACLKYQWNSDIPVFDIKLIIMQSISTDLSSYFALFMGKVIRQGVEMIQFCSILPCLYAIICCSRYYLEYHTPAQVYWGVTVGIVTGILWFCAVHILFTPYFAQITSWYVLSMYCFIY